MFVTDLVLLLPRVALLLDPANLALKVLGLDVDLAKPTGRKGEMGRCQLHAALGQWGVARIARTLLVSPPSLPPFQRARSSPPPPPPPSFSVPADWDGADAQRR